jgi:F-type H+-transporting ATPase subunit b
MAIEIDATFIALVALCLFVGVLIYLKVPAMVAGMLDTRSQEIAKELAEAQRLKDQAAALLAEYEGKRQAAEAQATEIVAQAKVQAAQLAAESKAQLAEALVRHERAAEEKIARAEAQAIADVRAAAVDAAVAAAEQALKAGLGGPGQAQLVDRGVAELSKSFG